MKRVQEINMPMIRLDCFLGNEAPYQPYLMHALCYMHKMEKVGETMCCPNPYCNRVQAGDLARTTAYKWLKYLRNCSCCHRNCWIRNQADMIEFSLEDKPFLCDNCSHLIVINTENGIELPEQLVQAITAHPEDSGASSHYENLDNNPEEIHERLLPWDETESD